MNVEKTWRDQWKLTAQAFLGQLSQPKSTLLPQAGARSASCNPTASRRFKTLRYYARMFRRNATRAFQARNFHNVRSPTYFYLDGTHRYCVIAAVMALPAPLFRSGMSLHTGQQHHQASATGSSKLEASLWKPLHAFIQSCSPRPPIRPMSARGTWWCFPAASLMQTPLSMCLAIVIRSSHAGSLRA